MGRMSPPRTSLSHPLQIAELAAPVVGSADAAPDARPLPGRLGITFCPGKHDRAAATGAWARDLALDLDAISAWGARLVLTLVEPAELTALQVPHLGQAVQARGMLWRHLPIADYAVPSVQGERLWSVQRAERCCRLSTSRA